MELLVYSIVALNSSYYRRFSLELFRYLFVLIREFYRNQAGGYEGDGVDYSNHRDSRHRHYSRTNRALAVILPIVGILVIAGAIAIVFLYYKKHPNILSKSKSNKTTTSIAVVKSDEYSGRRFSKIKKKKTYFSFSCSSRTN